MEIQTRTDKGRTRPKNEDAVGVWQKDGVAVIVLADGLGGHRAGEVASQMVVDSVFSYLEEKEPDRIDCVETLRSAAEHANELVYRKASEDPVYKGMGATVVFACVTKETIHIGHAGDSRAYLCGSDGLVQLTIDHCVSNEFQQEGREVSEKIRHMVTRAMGTEPKIQIDMQEIKPAEGTLVLLCSDGLSNELQPHEIEAIVSAEWSLSEKADRLIQTANDNGGKDNISIALIDWRGGSQ